MDCIRLSHRFVFARSRNLRLVLTWFSLVLLLPSLNDGRHAVAAAGPMTYYVATPGRDTWSGTLPAPDADKTDGPFATLDFACSAARKVGVKQPRTIVIGAGQYFFDKPVALTDRDSGLTIEAAPGANVCLYGGRKVTDFKKDGDKFYCVELPGVREGKWDFRALVVNGRFCRRARLPKDGFFTHLSRFDVPWMSTTGGGWKRKPTKDELTTLRYRPEDLGPWLDINNAEVTVYHMWDESLIGVSAIDPQSHTLTFASPAGHPPGAFGVKKYVVWNVREGMTEPGQWYLDRTAGKLVYWPVPGEDMATATVFAPTIESIVQIRGAGGKPAKDITIRGLTLSVTTTPLEAGGFGAGKFDGAISVRSAENCRILDIEVSNAGGQGIKASGNGLVIRRCHVHHTGACGVRFRGDRALVADNHIHDVGLTYPSAVALSGGGADSQVSHNEVHDTTYTAITYGGRDSRIEHNLIYRAMTELHDGGGIYCFAGKNLVLRGNFIRDIIDTGGYGASAYYLDERSENCLVEGNLSIDVVRPSHNHMATNNIIRNNVFVSSEDARLTFPRSSGYRYERNVVYAKGKIVVENPDAITTLRNNVFFSAEGQVQYRKLKQYSQVGSYLLKADGSNLLANPLLEQFRTGRVKFAADSPAVALGIKPIDVSGAGPRE